MRSRIAAASLPFFAGMLVVSPGATASAPAPGVQPQLSVRRDAALVIAGCTTLLASRLGEPEVRPVPRGGLDPGEIRFDFDARTVGNRDTGADAASNWTRNVALAFPMVLASASAPAGARWRAPLVRSVLVLESMAIAEGITAVTKNAVGRPRPFVYVAEVERPVDRHYQIDHGDRAFEAMPSGHATTAFCATSFGIVDHVLTRPFAGWKELASVGFAGGVLAGSTAALRVEAGQHFPTDVMAGAAIGATCGAAVPLLHRYVRAGQRAPWPSRRAWLSALGGTAAGVAAGILVGVAVGSN